METKIVIVNAFSGSEKKLNQKVDEALRDAGSEWEVYSATTSVAACQDFRGEIYIQWVTTIVFKKKGNKRSNRP